MSTKGLTTRPSVGRGSLISIAIILACSLAGSITATVALAGRTMPLSATAVWYGLLLASGLLLAGWAFLFAHLIHHRLRTTPERALYLAALGHLPLLAAIAVPVAVYTNDVANYLYSVSIHGREAFRPLTLLWLVAAPLVVQGAIVAAFHPRKVLAWLPALAPLFVALVLRLWSVNWQLPYRFHDDERAYLNAAMITWAHGDPNPHRFFNPSLMFYLDVALFNLLGGVPALVTRVVVALLSTGTVGLVYLSTRELLGRRAALFAAWFLAVSFLHVRNSHYGTNDVVATFFGAASFLFAAKLYRTGNWTHYLWAGILGGLATTTKYNLGLFVLPILVAHFARQKSFGLRSLLAPAGWLRLVICYAASALAFVAGTPYSILDSRIFLAGFWGQLGYGASPWFGQERLPTWWMQLTALVQGFGLFPFLMMLAGILYLGRFSPRLLALVAVLPAVYYAFMSRQQLYFVRFTIPMLPFLAILAGGGAAYLTGRLSKYPRGQLLVALSALVLFAQPLVYSVQHDLVVGRKDTRVLADEWIAGNLPRGSILFVDDYAVIRGSAGWPRARVERRDYDPTKDPEPWKEEPGRPVYLITSSFGWDAIRVSRGEKALLAAYQPLRDRGQLLITFNPGWGGQQVPYSADDTYTPFWYLLDRERGGPSVQLFRID